MKEEITLPLELLTQRFNLLNSKAAAESRRLYHASAFKDDANNRVCHNFDEMGTPDGNVLHSAIRAYNASEMLQLSLDLPEIDDKPETYVESEKGEELYSLTTSLQEVSEEIIRRTNNGEQGVAQLRWFACPKCGRELELYTFFDGDDTGLSVGCVIDARINTQAVYEFMHKSHLCDECWQTYVTTGE